MREAIRADEADDLWVEMALIRGPTPSTTRASPAAGHQGSSWVIMGHYGSSGVIRGHQRTRADARIAGRAPLVSTCASIAHQLVCRPVCSPDESESHMRAYLMREAIRRPQMSSEVISVRASEALPMQSEVIRCHQRSSAYERPRPSRCNQGSSDVIRGHQRTSARGPPDGARCAPRRDGSPARARGAVVSACSRLSADRVGNQWVLR